VAAVPRDCVRVASVLAVRGGSEGTQSALVKWGSCGYEDATWEAAAWVAAGTTPGGTAALARFQEVESRRGIKAAASAAAAAAGVASAAPSEEEHPVVREWYGGEGNVLRGYQREGVRWMAHNLLTAGRGCILADEMGLGKTAQALAVVDYILRSQRRSPLPTVAPRGPALVVVPLSTLVNWQGLPSLHAPPPVALPLTTRPPVAPPLAPCHLSRHLSRPHWPPCQAVTAPLVRPCNVGARGGVLGPRRVRRALHRTPTRAGPHPVGPCMFKFIDTRVETAWLQRLKLKHDEPRQMLFSTSTCARTIWRHELVYDEPTDPTDHVDPTDLVDPTEQALVESVDTVMEEGPEGEEGGAPAAAEAGASASTAGPGSRSGPVPGSGAGAGVVYKADVVLTTYEMVQADRGVLSKVGWCRLAVSIPVLKSRMLSALETRTC